MTFIDLFAGIGGFRLGMEMAGHKCLGHCEWDKFANYSYAAMHLLSAEEIEKLKQLDIKKAQKYIKDRIQGGEWFAQDIREIRASDIPRCDCWCFGFPCQDISIAGEQHGFAGKRSSLFFAVTKLIRELEEKDRPTYLFIENVKNLLSINRGFDFAKLLIELDEIGYNAEWQVLNSANFGVPQNRERVFIVGHLRSRGECRREVFPIGGTNIKTGIKVLGNTGRTRHGSLNVLSTLGISGALRARDYKGSQQVAIPILTPDRPNKRQNGRRFKENGEPMFILTSQDRHGVMVKIKEATKQGYAIASEGDSVNLEQPNSKTRRGRVGKGVAQTLTTSCNQGIFVQVSDELMVYAVWYPEYQCYIAIRKLTPKECFRLQGFPDEYFNRARLVNSDSQLYKQAGNGVTVNVIYEIARRMEVQEDESKANT